MGRGTYVIDSHEKLVGIIEKKQIKQNKKVIGGVSTSTGNGALKVMPHDISYIVRLREKIQVDLQQYGWKKSKTINNWHKYTKRFFLDSGVGATATYNDGKNKFSVEVAVDRVEVPGDLCQDHIDYCVSGAMDLIGQMERDLNIQAGLLEIKSKGHFAFRLPVWLWRWLWR